MKLPTIALSIWQPWAWLLAHGFKDVENRSWPAPASLIGKPVLLHAGRKVSRAANITAWTLAKANLSPADFDHFVTRDYPRGGIIGVATLRACIKDAASPWAEPGKYHWVLADARPIPFVPCPGQLRLFRVNPHYLAHLEAA